MQTKMTKKHRLAMVYLYNLYLRDHDTQIPFEVFVDNFYCDLYGMYFAHMSKPEYRQEIK